MCQAILTEPYQPPLLPVDSNGHVSFKGTCFGLGRQRPKAKPIFQHQIRDTTPSAPPPSAAHGLEFADVQAHLRGLHALVEGPVLVSRMNGHQERAEGASHHPHLTFCLHPKALKIRSGGVSYSSGTFTLWGNTPLNQLG